MNLKEGGGRVPVPSEGLVQDPGLTPWVLVPFPTREEFDEMYKRSSPETRDPELQFCPFAEDESHNQNRQSTYIYHSS